MIEQDLLIVNHDSSDGEEQGRKSSKSIALRLEEIEINGDISRTDTVTSTLEAGITKETK